MRSDGCLGAEFSTAEKDGKGMALKIFTGAKPFPKIDSWPSGITEIAMLTINAEVLNFKMK